jgi:catechol-2,3-dioxygenase
MEAMAGLIFIKCMNLEKLIDFYTNVIKCNIWLEQPEITILAHENFLFGFHQIAEIEKESYIPSKDIVLTFFFEQKQKVDEFYNRLNELNLVISEPKVNEKYNIYNFFAKDPEGHIIEFQVFLHTLKDLKPSFIQR